MQTPLFRVLRVYHRRRYKALASGCAIFQRLIHILQPLWLVNLSGVRSCPRLQRVGRLFEGLPFLESLILLRVAVVCTNPDGPSPPSV